MSTTLVVALIIAWGAIGLLSGLWMARHGHEPLWTLIALVLGPLFIPIALERVQRRPGVAAFGPKGAPPQRSEANTGLRMLVGLDGSAESKRALATALRLFGSQCELLVLAEVVHFETAEYATHTDVDTASHRLAEVATSAEIAGVVHTEVLAGAPGPTLRGFADRQDMDLLVVGRRGRGLSTRLLGSVSADIIQHSAVPVLIIEPVHDPARPSAHRRGKGHVAPHKSVKGT
ncbi:universal stress protein [Mycolicibacterium gadium]|uniref:universal stress protein n=1 Tax=Mycolicibacterium gadium TaxID=1794 RepID=UPI002FDCF3A8